MFYTRVSPYLGWFESHGLELTLLGQEPTEPSDVVTLGAGQSRFTATGTLQANAVDTYTVDVPAGTRVVVSTLSSIDTYGTLVVAGQAVAENDDAGQNLNLHGGDGLDR